MTSRTAIEDPAPGTFADRVGVELNRAERYRVFVSLTVFDLSLARDVAGKGAGDLMSQLSDVVRNSIRACDFAEILNGQCLALLFPETPRQGAEIASRRLVGVVREKLREITGQLVDEVIPTEIASYPDSAGARTLNGFLVELANKSRN